MFKRRSARYALAAVTALVLLSGVLAMSQTAAQAAAPTYQVCSQSGSQYCINRAGGGTANGTQLIAWSKNDPNNNFSFLAASNICGNGKVSITCPDLGNSQINAALDGALIGFIGIAGKNQCLAVGGKLQACGSTGTEQIFSYCGDTIAECTGSLVINRYFTAANKSPRYVAIPNTLRGHIEDGTTTEDVLDVIFS